MPWNIETDIMLSRPTFKKISTTPHTWCNDNVIFMDETKINCYKGSDPPPNLPMKKTFIESNLLTKKTFLMFYQ